MTDFIDSIESPEDNTPDNFELESYDNDPVETQAAQPKPEPGTVPLGALHEERARRKELQAEIASMKEQLASLDEIRSQLEGLREQQHTPDPDDDPLGNLEWQNQSMRSELDELKMYTEQQQIEQQQLQQQQQVISRYQADAQQFMKNNPDFVNAYNHLTQSRIAEYETLGYSTQQAQEALASDEWGIVQKAYEDGVNPAERIFAAAKLRGFNGSDLSSVQAGLDSQTQVTSANSIPEADGSIEKLLSMDGDEFDQFWNKTFPAN